MSEQTILLLTLGTFQLAYVLHPNLHVFYPLSANPIVAPFLVMLILGYAW